MKESKMRIERSKDDYNIVKVNIDEKWIYIGSKYNMDNEIGKFLQKINDAKKIIIFGAGTGDHIRALREKKRDIEIIVFEPNNDIAEYVQSLEFVKKDLKIEVYKCNREEVNKNLNEEFLNEFNVQDIRIVSFSNYEKLYPKQFIDLMDILKEKIYDCIVSRNTKIQFSERWFTTTINNIADMTKATLIDEYTGMYKNKPAIIVSAGPSLDKNIDQLKGIEDNFLVITGGRPIKGLIEKKIRPGLLVALDPQDINYRLVKGCIEDTDIPLLFFECTNEKIVQNHKGMKIFSLGSEEMYHFIDRDCVILPTFGSVAHSMTSAAVALGCNPVIFIGQDFAYTGDATHSDFLDKRLVNESDKFEDVKSDIDPYVESVDGGKVRTSVILNIYRLGMEQIIADNPNVKFINATEGGARMAGTEEMTLKEAIEKYGDKEIEPLPNKKADPIISKRIIDKLDNMYNELIEIEKECKKALKYTNEMEKSLKLKRRDKVVETIKKLDKVDAYIKNKITSFLIIQSLLYPIMYKILTNRKIDNEESEEVKIQHIIEQNRELYESLINAIEGTSSDFKDVIKKIKPIKEEIISV